MRGNHPRYALRTKDDAQNKGSAPFQAAALDSMVKMLGYDQAQVEKELAAQASEGQVAPIDPKTLTNDEWELFKRINARRLAQLGK